MNVSQLEEILATVECVAEPNTLQLAELQKVLTAPGFQVFMGLLLSVRNGHLQMIANLPIVSKEDHWRTAVLQGQIKSVDIIRETLLQLYQPKDATPQPKSHQTGV